MSSDRDAIATVLDLRVGGSFTLRGRRWTISGYGGSTIGADARGEYLRLRVWNDAGRETLVTVRPADRLT